MNEWIVVGVVVIGTLAMAGGGLLSMFRGGKGGKGGEGPPKA